MVRSMVSHIDLPTSFWGYALETTAFTLNCVPSKLVQKTPHEMWTGRRPNMSFIRVWGCQAYVKHQMSTKLEPKSQKCTFVGYPKETKGYYFYNSKENKVFVARMRVFLEKDFLSYNENGRNIELKAVQQQQVHEPEVEETPQVVEGNSTDLETQPLRRSTRERHEPERYGFLVTTHGDVILVEQDEPKTYQEAVSSPDSEKWLEAMRSEMDSMSENQVWTLVEPPEGIKPIGCKWVFKKKTDMDGNVQTYKMRLVAKGFRQIHGVDYDETFSPVAMFKSIRILLAIAAFHDFEIWQMDVKTAFLNGKLEEDVYMTQPKGFVTTENAGKVCKLQRFIYGLQQASRSWNLRFNDAIKEFGFIRNEDEPCVYKKFSGSIVSFLILYVDDILIIGNDIPTLQSIKTWLSSCFSMKDLGEAAYILGVKIYRDRSRRLLGLSQSTYIDKVLKRFSMEESKRGFLPMRHGISLSKEMCLSTPQERKRMSQIRYASAIGSLMYAMICTRPDLSYAVSMTSRYQANPGEGHWTVVKNILKYLRRTKDVFLVYGGEEELRIKGYTDASFQRDKDDSRSQSEAEYIATSEAAKEVVWIKKFITGLGVIPSISDAVDLYCDNNGAIAQAKESISHQRSKHIFRRFHLIREIIDRGDVEICKVHTDDNIADPLTKPLAQQKHDRHTESLGIRYAFRKGFPSSCSLVYSGGLSRDLDEIFVEIQDPSSPTETLLRLLLPLNDKVLWTSRDVAGSEPPTSPRYEHFTGPLNRINQVAFLRDVRPAWSSMHYLGRGDAITGRDHRSCRGTKCTSYERPGPRPYAHEIFLIQKHDRASMHRRGRIMPINTLRTPSTTEVHQAATRPLDEKGMTIHPKFHRFRYATQDPYRTPWSRRPQGEDIEEECGSTVRCMKHGACRHIQPIHHSHAHCVLVAASTPTGPQPARAKDSIEERRKQ
ncbi:hypothetical protein V6N13_008211 [Hibiscus sabdariffa]